MATGPRLTSHHPVVNRTLEFELVEGRDLLRYTLSAAVDACVDGWRYSTSWFGIIPRNSVVDKFPWHRSSIAQQPESCVPPDLKWLLKTQAAIQQQQQQQQQANEGLEREGAAYSTASAAPNSQAASTTAVRAQARLRPAYYARDFATRPSMIPIYNILLIWALFHVDVRASSL